MIALFLLSSMAFAQDGKSQQSKGGEDKGAESSRENAAPKKRCVFQDKQLGELDEEGSGFKNIDKDDRYQGIPKLFDSYKKELGEWSKTECKKAVKVTKYVSFEDHKVYTAYFTNEDYCDGGNSYGLILTDKKEDSPRGDKVIATITDSFIDCLKK